LVGAPRNIGFWWKNVPGGKSGITQEVPAGGKGIQGRKKHGITHFSKKKRNPRKKNYF